MGLFNLFKKKETAVEQKRSGIDEQQFNSENHQMTLIALAVWKLETSKGDAQVAKAALREAGLNDAQTEEIMKKATLIQMDRKAGMAENTFNAEDFQKKTVEKSVEVYFKNNQNFDAVKQELLNDGMNNAQSEHILAKLKLQIKGMVDNFKQELDSGVIESIKIEPNPEHVKGNVDALQVDKYIGYGAFQLERGDLENALQLFDKAIELDENAVLAYANKGALYAKKGEHEKALKLFDKALTIDPNQVQVLEGKMNFLFERINEWGDKKFIDAVKALLNIEPAHPNALIFIIQYHLHEKDMESALKSVKLLFANHHRENDAISLLLNTFHSLPKERALEEFANYSNELAADAKYQLGYCKGLYLLGMQDYDPAISIFEELNKQQEFSWNFYQIAIIKNFQNKTDECLKYLKKTFALEPGLKEDAKQIPYFQNLAGNREFIELMK